MFTRSYVASVSDDDDVADSSFAADDDDGKHRLNDGERDDLEMVMAVPLSSAAELSSVSAFSTATTAVKSSSASSCDAADILRGSPKTGLGANGEVRNGSVDEHAASERSSGDELQGKEEAEDCDTTLLKNAVGGEAP